MKSKSIVLLFGALLMLMGCGGNRKQTIDKKAFSGTGYSLTAPTGWEVNHQGAMGADMFIRSPQETPEDRFVENVNVVLQNLPNGMTPQQYLDVSAKQVVEAFGLPADTTFAPCKVGDEEGYHLRYGGKMGAREMDFDGFVVFNNGGAYVITCTYEKGKRAIFQKTMDEIVASFRLDK